MTRVLLTGGLGFIGHHVIEHWLENTDWEIVVLDSLRYAGRIERLTDIEGYDPSRCDVFWHDLRSPIHTTLARNIGDVNHIVNMASDSHVDRSITDPVPFVHNNVMIVLTMLEYARQVKPEKFVQISTDEVYGPAPAGISHKEGDPLRPSNPYSASKAAQEAIAFSYWRTYDVPVIVTNTMNNFGERQENVKYVPNSLQRILNGETVQIHARPNSDGTWTPGSRVWLHARNHASALHFILDQIGVPRYTEGIDGHPRFNVAGEKEVDNLTIAQLIADIVGRELRYEMVDFHSSRPGHDLRYSLDGSKLRNEGWKAPLSMEESFEKTIKWYERNRHWLDS